MASKYRVSPRKKRITDLEVVVSSLSKENDCLKTTLAESRRHYTTLNKLLERFLTLETVRLEGSRQLEAQVRKNASPTEQLSEVEDNQMDGASTRIRRITSSYAETEELKNKLVSVSARCQSLENKVAKNKQDSTSDEQALTDDIQALQSNLKDALEKNKQWLEYDQQREAYVRAILARMLWLEKQLNEANPACLQQHNEDHSDEKVQINQMQERYESLLQGANDELEVLRYQLGETSRELTRTQNSFKEREEEVEELRQQRQFLKRSREGEEERAETEDLRHRLDEEKRKSANLELQEDIFESVFKDIYKADQQKIAHLKRQIRISSQDLEDERQDCLYLRKQIVKLLKRLRNSTGHLMKASKREQQDHGPCEVAPPPSPPTRDGLHSSPNSSLLDESWLECPICRSQYAAHQHRDLVYHLDVCHD